MRDTRDPGELDREHDTRLAAAHQRLTAAVAELTSSHGWQAMLTLAARLPTYSANNILLIGAQRPDATHVAGYTTWRQLGRHVRKGETGIAILAPCLYRPNREPAPDTTNRETLQTQQPQEEAARVLAGFRVVHVFDITQTDGELLPDLDPHPLRGTAPAHLWQHLADLASTEGYEIERGPCNGAYGQTRFDHRTIRIRADIDDAHAAKTLAHELGHIRADHEHRYLDQYDRVPACRGAAEVEAESIAYLVTATAGLDTLRYSVPYIAHWAGGDITLLHHTAARVIKTAAGITSGSAVVPARAEEASRTPRRATPTTTRTRGRDRVLP